MTVKRILLGIITVIVLIPLLLSLGESFGEPQVQSDLQLSQTNLILQASEIAPETLKLEGFAEGKAALLGQDPYKLAEEQYQSALKDLNRQHQNLTQPPSPDPSPLDHLPEIAKPSATATEASQQKKLNLNRQAQQKLTLKLGLIEAKQGNREGAIAQWQATAQLTSDEPHYAQAAIALQNLWQKAPITANKVPELESLFETTLVGWFRDQALHQLYSRAGDSDRLTKLEQRVQTQAQQTIIKLAILSLIPIVLGLSGCGILIFLLAQWLLQKDDSLLAAVGKIRWETPWDGEIIWQVLVVGFFLVGQIIVPLTFGLLRFNPQSMGLREKAVYVLLSYLTMTLGGLGVLFFSIKSHFPLPKGWFRIDGCDRSWLWGLGGYLVALPLVVLVSLVNQTLWNGQGGSNPLLSLALESQDRVVLGIFFFTAAIAAPFFEEMIFRGFLIPSLTRYVPVWGAIGISSLIFALAHLNLSEVLPLATLGIILGVVYTRSQNLLASMLLHSLWNSGTLLSLFILGSGG